MKIALASVGFITNDIEYNKGQIIKVIEEYSDKADLILFGESFLQGFECLKWDYDVDRNTAISLKSEEIKEIAEKALECKVSVSFGYIEKDEDRLFSSQLTIDAEGCIVNNFRRVSTGWKEPVADFHYCEGDEFPVFDLKGLRISLGLCGDLWYEENCSIIKNSDADLILWPVYTDYNFEKWNKEIKYEYAEQAGKLAKKVLYVNSFCIDGKGDKIAKGGSAFFKDGVIVKEEPSGKESTLIVEI